MFLGWKARGIIFGGSIEVLWVATHAEETDMADATSSAAVVQLAPGIRVDVLASDDGRLQLFGAADLGAGKVFIARGEPDDGRDRGGFAWFADLGPGLRYWIAPQFALGAAAGLRYDHLRSTAEGGGVRAESRISVLSVFGALDLMGVF